jgi:hypothetical protein
MAAEYCFNFRRISLPNFCCKIYAKILSNRINKIAELTLIEKQNVSEKC